MAVPDPTGLLREWQQALGRLASMPANAQEIARQLAAPMEMQARLVEQALERQLAFQHDLADRLFEPLTRFREVLDEVAGSMRTQANAVRQTSASLQDVADLLDAQASLIEQGSAAMLEGVLSLRSTFAPAPEEGTSTT